jgi:hypothetical protein
MACGAFRHVGYTRGITEGDLFGAGIVDDYGRFVSSIRYVSNGKSWEAIRTKQSAWTALAHVG